MYDKSIELYHNEMPITAVIKVNVSISKDFKTLVGTKTENWGYIEISSSNTNEYKVCFWDNMNFFLKAPKADIKEHCKQELIDKGFYYKGFFKDLQNMINELVEAGYLTRDCKKDY